MHNDQALEIIKKNIKEFEKENPSNELELKFIVQNIKI